MARMPALVEAAALPPADEFMTLWDYVPDPGPMVRDPMWRQIALHELTRPADWTPIPVATAPVPEPDAMERLVASGIATEYVATLGALRDPDAPYLPRSIGFPVTLHRVGGHFQPPSAPRIWELHLKTPACGDLPFVHKIEEVTGLKAKWAPDSNRGMCGQWHHAIDLATDARWEQLASSMEHTTTEAVARSAGIHVCDGSISASNARRLLLAVGVPEPETRAGLNICPNPNGGLVTSLGGWQAIHAVEDGLIVPGNPKRHTYARATEAGWRSVGKEPPAPPAPKAKRAKAAPPSDRLTALVDGAGVGRRTRRDVAVIEAAIAASLPDDVPTFVSVVLSVRRDGEVLVTRVRLFDGGIVVLRVDGGPEPHVRGWDPEGEDRRAFHYVDGAWTRVEDACVGEVI